MSNQNNKALDHDLSSARLIRDVATKAAIKAGRTIKQYWGESTNSLEVKHKSSWRDMVTVADKKSEEVILKIVRESFPDHQIISEEGGGTEVSSIQSINNSPNTSKYKWAIDPLDGTTNFRHSYPFFCVSIGVLFEDKPLVGVVYNPIQDELFTAIKGQGAYLNGQKMSVSKVATLRDSLLVTGFAYSINELQKSSMELFKELSFATHGVRRDGAAALDLCYVAAGRLDAFWEYGLHIWDIAAGALIVEEAGGVVTDPIDGNLDLFGNKILASNALIAEELISKIQNSQKLHAGAVS